MNESEKSAQENFPNDLISVKDEAEISGLTPRHVRLLIRQEKLKGFKMGRDWFTTEQAVQEYLAKDRKPGPKLKK